MFSSWAGRDKGIYGKSDGSALRALLDWLMVRVSANQFHIALTRVGR